MKLIDLRNAKENGVVSENVTIFSKADEPVDIKDMMINFVKKFGVAYFKKMGFDRVETTMVKFAKSTLEVNNPVEVSHVMFNCFMKDMLVTSAGCMFTCDKTTEPAVYRINFGSYPGIYTGAMVSEQVQTDFAAKGNAAFANKFRKE